MTDNVPLSASAAPGPSPLDTAASSSAGGARRVGRRGALSVLLSIALVGACAAATEPQEIFAKLEQLDARWLGVALALHVLSVVLLGLRWSRIAHFCGVALEWRAASKEYALSILLNQVLPSGMAGDALRAARHAGSGSTAEPDAPLSTKRLGSVLGVLVLDRVSGQLALGLVAVAVAPFAPRLGVFQETTLALGLGAVALLCITLFCITVWGAARRSAWLQALVASAVRFARHAARTLLSPRAAREHLPLSLVLLTLQLAQMYVAGCALGLDVPWTTLLILGPWISLAASLPTFFGGWGARETAAGLVFAAAGLSASAGVALSLVYGLFSLLVSLPAVVILLTPHVVSARFHERWLPLHSVATLFALAVAAWLRLPALFAVFVAATLTALVIGERGQWTPRGGFGSANVLTTLRAVSVMGMLVTAERLSGTTLALWALVTSGLDILDGWVARRTAQASQFGACFDIETDALFAATLPLLLFQRGLAGPWVLLAGAWHYVYVLAPYVAPTTEGADKGSRFGRGLYTGMVLSFLAALLVPPSLAPALCAAGTVAVSISFAYSFWLRYGAVWSRHLP